MAHGPLPDRSKESHSSPPACLLLPCRSGESKLKRWLRDAFKPVPINSQGMRATSLAYGVMVIDMGVHELDGLEEPMNLTQVSQPF